MTVAEMRLLVGLPDTATDAEVVAAYTALGQVVEAGDEPITLEQAKAHLKLPDSSTSEDLVIESAIADARGWIEDYTGLVLVRRQITQTISGFARTLRAWPIISIDSIRYRGRDGVDAVLPGNTYFAQITRRPASVLQATGIVWPSLYPGSAVIVTATAGFADANAINAFSPNIMRAMKVLLSEYYDNRGAPELSEHAENVAKRLCRSKKQWSV